MLSHSVWSDIPDTGQACLTARSALHIPGSRDPSGVEADQAHLDRILDRLAVARAFEGYGHCGCGSLTGDAPGSQAEKMYRADTKNS